jgi:hypothetical protein
MRRVTRSDPDLRHLKRRETDRRDPLEDARVVTDGMWTCPSCGRIEPW